MGALANSPVASYVGWEEVVVSSEKGRREVHYYLKRRGGGGSDLVVVGKEKSPRHMSYYYRIKDSAIKSSTLIKLRSRREVIDWLNSIVPGLNPQKFSSALKNFVEEKDTEKFKIEVLKDVRTRMPVANPIEFMWLGSPWTCRRRRMHYPSFCRNGFKISVHDFVYVLAEEDKRLVAYVDDMYEDPRGNNMVVVRWFHKIDEVGFVLPHTYNDREILFSLCLQDLSIECIDGLATVLSPEHYEKFLEEGNSVVWRPFVCSRLFDNDDVKPYDITHIKGYWKQEVVRHLFYSSCSLSELSFDDCNVGGMSNVIGIRPKKRLCRSRELEISQHADKEAVNPILQGCNGRLAPSDGDIRMDSQREDCSDLSLSKKEPLAENNSQVLAIGSHVEVLCQDSGIRGCWFRALIIKKHKDKVKVRYQDIKDAADDAKNLEEWVLAARLAAADELGIRISGRTVVRPIPPLDKERALVANVGSIIDAWWHDGWWEGIVMKKESEDRFHVYLPGEKRQIVFSLNNLRLSREWFSNGWEHFKQRPELVSGLSKRETNQSSSKLTKVNSNAALSNQVDVHGSIHVNGHCYPTTSNENSKKLEAVQDLLKDALLAQLRWRSSRKRRVRSPSHKIQYGRNENNSANYSRMPAYQKSFAPSALSVDRDNCKSSGRPPFSSSVITPLTSLVMSR